MKVAAYEPVAPVAEPMLAEICAVLKRELELSGNVTEVGDVEERVRAARLRLGAAGRVGPAGHVRDSAVRQQVQPRKSGRAGEGSERRLGRVP